MGSRRCTTDPKGCRALWQRRHDHLACALHVHNLKSSLTRARLNVYSILSFTPDLGYWIENSYRVEFQNMSTAWIIEGIDLIVDGGGCNKAASMEMDRLGMVEPQVKVTSMDVRSVFQSITVRTSASTTLPSTNHSSGLSGLKTREILP